MEVHAAERAVRVVVVDRLAVLDAVAGVVEPRAGGHRAGVERRGGRHDLERRARRVEAGRGAVQQPCRRRAGRRPAEDLAVVPLDLVGVVARRCSHGEHGAGGRLEGDGGAAVPGERALRGALELRVDRQRDRVADDGLPRQCVELRAEHRAQAAVRAGEIVVQRPLDPGPRASLGRVADEVRGQIPLWIAAEVERLAVHLLLPVRGQHRAVRRANEPALDLELGDALDGVVLTRGEVSRCPGLPVRRAHDEGTDQDEADERDPADLGIHGRAPPRGSRRAAAPPA